VGRAFQIADDVLDSSSDEASTGKSVGLDLQEGKLTLPMLLACESDPALGRRVRAQLGAEGVPREAAAELLAAARAAGGIEQAQQQAQDLAQAAIRELDALPPSPYRDALRDLALFCVDRKS
jgi:octaprenyl-diphosphate synthase